MNFSAKRERLLDLDFLSIDSSVYLYFNEVKTIFRFVPKRIAAGSYQPATNVIKREVCKLPLYWERKVLIAVFHNFALSLKGIHRMVLYNITWVTEAAVEETLIDYLRSTFIPSVVSDGSMHSPALHRIEKGAQEEGVSLALHFFADQSTDIDVYWCGPGAKHIATLIGKFGNRVMGFATTMRRIEL